MGVRKEDPPLFLTGLPTLKHGNKKGSVPFSHSHSK